MTYSLGLGLLTMLTVILACIEAIVCLRSEDRKLCKLGAIWFGIEILLVVLCGIYMLVQM